VGAFGEAEGREVSGARDDIPRERFFYPGGFDGIRQTTPYTPVNGATGAAPRIPLVGVAIVAGLVLWFEHMRKSRGR
jgi:hypothetical protein